MADKPSRPLDPAWVKNTAQLLEKLKDLKWRYVEGPAKRGRAEMGIVNSTGCTSVWGSTYPFHPYPFPWTSHLFQDSALGGDGHLRGPHGEDGRRLQGAAHGREGAGRRLPAERDEDFFRRFNWQQFSEEEWLLCPPVVSLGGDGAMYDIGFQNLSRALMSGMPIKVLVVDTQVYSNTGGQACTSGFIGQVSDMAPFGAAQRGKQETRKEISLIGMAHRTSYVMSGTIAHSQPPDRELHRRPQQPPPGAVQHLRRVPARARRRRRQERGPEQAGGGGPRLSAVPLRSGCRHHLRRMRQPGRQPGARQDWPTYTLKYVDEQGAEQSMTLPMTFADFAATEARFLKQFSKAPPETWNDDMVPVAEFLQLDKDEREGQVPLHLGGGQEEPPDAPAGDRGTGASCEERLQLLAPVARRRRPRPRRCGYRGAADQVRAELLAKISASLGRAAAWTCRRPMSALALAARIRGTRGRDYEPVWVESPECTACDECTTSAPKVFVYNDQKLAVVVNPKGAKFADIVKAAEKCTAGCLHPGTPWNMSEPGIEKLMARAAKFN
jgi:pyruvate-ferredoxin/flavodoxin oxidoreductase